MGVPAGPRFVLGWLIRYAISPYEVWRALVDRYGDPFFLRLPESPGTVATGTPAGARAIVSADASTLVPWRIPATAALLTDDSIFLQSGDAHRATRRLLAPLFSPQRADAHCADMAAAVAAELDALPAGPVVIHALAQRLTLRIILAVLFAPSDSTTPLTLPAGELALDLEFTDKGLTRVHSRSLTAVPGLILKETQS